VVITDEFVGFMWIRIRGFAPLPRDIYIAICYFPPTSSNFAIHRDSIGDPYLNLYADIC
jgi:hypothetical protein